MSPLALLLTLVFVVLRSVGCIAWSWFWVLSPLLFVCVIEFGADPGDVFDLFED